MMGVFCVFCHDAKWDHFEGVKVDVLPLYV